MTRPGTRTLSEVVKHLCLPAGIVSTGWPAVRDTCGELGIRFDPWQDGLGRAILAKRVDGSYACGIGGAVISIPRQVGKTYLIGAITFALCLLKPGTTVIWTAHRVRTANETFQAMQAMAARRSIAPHIATVVLGSGDEAVLFTNGSRILFGARERGFGRGFADVDVIVLDEGQIMTESVMDDMVPATNVADNPLIIMTGTPPRPRDPGEVFTGKRKDGLAKDPDTLYVEIGADLDADPADRRQWSKANPSYPHRTPASAILRMKKMLSAESFRREALGVWDEAKIAPRVIDPFRWQELAGPAPEEDETGIAYAVKFSVDGKRMVLAVAVAREDGPDFVEVIDAAPTTVGVAGVANWLCERWRESRAIVIDGKSGAGPLVDELHAQGVRPSKIRRPTFEEAVTAYGGLLQACISGTVSHSGQPGLTESVAGTTRRSIGTAGGWGFRPVDEDDDEVPVEAVALALWGLTRGKGRTRKKKTAADTGSTQHRRGREAVVM